MGFGRRKKAKARRVRWPFSATPKCLRTTERISPEWSRRRASVVEALYRRIAATRIDDRGAAADRTLRYVEAAAPVKLIGRLEWVASDPPDIDWIALLDAACAATLAFGKLKLDGYGTAIASATPTSSKAAPIGSVSRFGKEHRVHLLLTQTRPAVFSRSAATEGAHATLDAPTGGSLLGWAAATSGYDNFFDPFQVFHSGAVRFGNATPLGPDHTVCVPMPKLFMAPKHDAGGSEAQGRVGDKVRIGRPVASPQTTAAGGQPEARVQYEHAPAAPFVVTPTGCVVRPARGQRLRTATRQGRAAEGRLFGYEHLSGEGRPVFVATLERDDDVSNEDWWRLLEAFEGRTARLGRARGTSYGGEFLCRVASASGDPEPIPKGTEGLLRVLALSDLALVDDFGVPSAEPEHKMLGLPPARLVGGDSVMSLRRHAPWNGKLRARDMERQTIEAGSVLSFELEEPLAEALPAKAAVGLWREAGFGQIWISPPFLRGSGAPCFDEHCGTVTLPDDARESAPAVEDSDSAESCDAMSGRSASNASNVPESQASITGDRLHMVRVSFELLSPLSIGSGERQTETRKECGADGAEKETSISVSEIQRDANGLPTIPGPGLQGVLRRLAVEVHGEEFAREMFGFEGAGDDGAAGRVACGWACVQDAAGVAVSGPRPSVPGESNDGILQLLKRPEPPLWRDHVALNDRHSVDGRRKFARAAVPVGARFSLELNGWGDDGFRDNLTKVVALFRHPRLRLGAGSGRGYGRVHLLAASQAAPSLDDAHGLRELRKQPPSTGLKTDLLQEIESSRAGDTDTDTVLTLNLDCTDLLRIGAMGPHVQNLTHDAQRARCAKTGNVVESHALGRPEQAGGRRDPDVAARTAHRLEREPRPGDRGRRESRRESGRATALPHSGLVDTRTAGAPDAVSCQPSRGTLHRRGRVDEGE